MSLEVFSSAWADEWARLLNQSAGYRAAAAAWEASIVLVMTQSGAAEAERRGVFADLWRGECRTARVATPRTWKPRGTC